MYDDSCIETEQTSPTIPDTMDFGSTSSETEFKSSQSSYVLY